jgi:inner membrane protein
MLLFGHAGITLGAAALAARAAGKRRADQAVKTSWFAQLSSYSDIRLLIIGSLLPDIIDKPVGQYFFREAFYNGRIFAHTLLFLVLITAAGYYLYRRHSQLGMLALAGGTFTHLVLDKIWETPGTLFWPVLGLAFTRYELDDWAAGLLRALLSNPYIYISEAAGLVILLWFGVRVISRKKVMTFLWRGKIY